MFWEGILVKNMDDEICTIIFEKKISKKTIINMSDEPVLENISLDDSVDVQKIQSNNVFHFISHIKPIKLNLFFLIIDSRWNSTWW